MAAPQTWHELSSDNRFLGLSPDDKIKLASAFFRDKVQNNPSLSPEERYRAAGRIQREMPFLLDARPQSWYREALGSLTAGPTTALTGVMELAAQGGELAARVADAVTGRGFNAQKTQDESGQPYVPFSQRLGELGREVAEERRQEITKTPATTVRAHVGRAIGDLGFVIPAAVASGPAAPATVMSYMKGQGASTAEAAAYTVGFELLGPVLTKLGLPASLRVLGGAAAGAGASAPQIKEALTNPDYTPTERAAALVVPTILAGLGGLAGVRESSFPWARPRSTDAAAGGRLAPEAQKPLEAHALLEDIVLEKRKVLPEGSTATDAGAVTPMQVHDAAATFLGGRSFKDIKPQEMEFLSEVWERVQKQVTPDAAVTLQGTYRGKYYLKGDRWYRDARFNDPVSPTDVLHNRLLDDALAASGSDVRRPTAETEVSTRPLDEVLLHQSLEGGRIPPAFQTTTDALRTLKGVLSGEKVVVPDTNRYMEPNMLTTEGVDAALKQVLGDSRLSFTSEEIEYLTQQIAQSVQRSLDADYAAQLKEYNASVPVSSERGAVKFHTMPPPEPARGAASVDMSETSLTPGRFAPPKEPLPLNQEIPPKPLPKPAIAPQPMGGENAILNKAKGKIKIWDGVPGYDTMGGFAPPEVLARVAATFGGGAVGFFEDKDAPIGERLAKSLLYGLGAGVATTFGPRAIRKSYNYMKAVGARWKVSQETNQYIKNNHLTVAQSPNIAHDWVSPFWYLTRAFPDTRKTYERVHDMMGTASRLTNQFFYGDTGGGAAYGLRSFLLLPKPSRQLVGDALVSGTLKRKTFTTDELRAQGLSDAEIQAYEGMRSLLQSVPKEIERSLSDVDLSDATRRELSEALHRMQHEGYAPLRRYGDWVVQADLAGVDPQKRVGALEGTGDRYSARFETKEEAYAHLVEIKKQGASNASFSQDTAGMDAKLRNYGVSTRNLNAIMELVGSVSDKAGLELLNTVGKTLGMDAETLAAFGEHFLQRARELNAQAVETYAARQGMRAHLAPQQGIAGFSRDYTRVYNDYFVGMAHFLSKLKHSREVVDSLSSIQSPPVKATIRGFVDRYLLSEPKVTDDIKNTSSFFALAGKAASGLANLSSTYFQTLPFLIKEHGKAESLRAFRQAHNLTFQLMRNDFRAWREGVVQSAQDRYAHVPPAYRDVVRRAATEGVFTDSEIFELARQHGLERMGLSADSAAKAVAASNTLMLPMRITEVFNRNVTFIAKAIAEINRGASPETAFRRARFFTNQTQAEFQRGSRPKAFDTPGLNIALGLKSFQNNLVHLTIDALKHAPHGSAEGRLPGFAAAATMLGAYFFVSGLHGVPGMDDALNALKLATGKNLDDKIREFLGNERFADILLRGVPTLFDVDLSSVVGMGRIFPIEPTDSAVQFASSLAGPTGGHLLQAGRATHNLLTGKITRLSEGLAQTPFLPAVRNIGRALRTASDGGQYRTTSTGQAVGNPLTTGEMVGMAVGLPPLSLTKAQDVREMAHDQMEGARRRTARYYNRLALALVRGDRKVFENITREIEEYNNDVISSGHPEDAIKVTKQGLKQHILSAENARALIRTAPKGRREALMRAFERYGQGHQEETIEPRAQGGPILPGHTYLVGEAGPEAVVTPEGATAVTQPTILQPEQAGSVIPMSNPDSPPPSIPTLPVGEGNTLTASMEREMIERVLSDRELKDDDQRLDAVLGQTLWSDDVPDFVRQRMKDVLQAEGWKYTTKRPYEHHPNDPGGATKYGITQRYDEKDMTDLGRAHVADITINDAAKLYTQRYFTNLGLDKLVDTSPGLTHMLFDTAIQNGPSFATDMLHALLSGVSPEEIGKRQTFRGGKLTAGDLERLAEMDNHERLALLDAMVAARVARAEARGESNPRLRVFVEGWKRRANNLKKLAALDV